MHHDLREMALIDVVNQMDASCHSNHQFSETWGTQSIHKIWVTVIDVCKTPPSSSRTTGPIFNPVVCGDADDDDDRLAPSRRDYRCKNWDIIEEMAYALLTVVMKLRFWVNAATITDAFMDNMQFVITIAIFGPGLDLVVMWRGQNQITSANWTHRRHVSYILQLLLLLSCLRIIVENGFGHHFSCYNSPNLVATSLISQRSTLRSHRECKIFLLSGMNCRWAPAFIILHNNRCPENKSASGSRRGFTTSIRYRDRSSHRDNIS